MFMSKMLQFCLLHSKSFLIDCGIFMHCLYNYLVHFIVIANFTLFVKDMLVNLNTSVTAFSESSFWSIIN